MPAALVAVVATASCTAPSPESERSTPEEPRASGPAVVAPDLSLRLVKLSASRVGRADVAPRLVERPAEAVRRSIEDLYRAAFVDPERWEDGQYPGLLSHFSGEARDRVLDDLDLLTLVQAASEVEQVRPQRAIVRLEFLVDSRRRPLVAFAETEFNATARIGDAESPIRQRADYVLRRLNGAWRVVSYEVRGRVPGSERDRAEPDEVAFAPGVPGTRPLFVLVIGSDARPRQSVTRTRADSIHIVGIDPGSGRGTVLGIPRDSWVPIPGWGTDKINAALVRGGPELLVDTVERVAGIRIDGYVLTGFSGFRRLVDAIGGIRVDIPYPIHDVLAGARFRRGSRHLDGTAALAFSRARHDVPRGDFSRSFNQGRVLLAALAMLREQATRGPAALMPWLIAGARYLYTDLTFDELFGLALAATAFDPGRVRNHVVSGHTSTIAGKSVVILDAGARAAFRDLARDGVLGS